MNTAIAKKENKETKPNNKMHNSLYAVDTICIKRMEILYIYGWFTYVLHTGD